MSHYKKLAYESLIDLLPQYVKDSIFATQGEHIITMTDVNGKINKIHTYLRPGGGLGTVDDEGQAYEYDAEGIYAVLNDDQGKMVYIQYFVLDHFLVGKKYFK